MTGSEKKVFPLSAITGRLNEILKPASQKSFWVNAEISSGSRKGGIFYCDLVEMSEGKVVARLACRIWAQDLTAIEKRFKEEGVDLRLEDGTEIVLKCSLQFHSIHGLSLRVVDADQGFAVGELERKKREILEKLAREGLLQPNKEKKVPMLPQRIGLITSKNSAAFNDFVHTLRTSEYGFKVYFAESGVQGKDTETSFVKALKQLSRIAPDLVVIIRGGGSKSDLFWLDNEVIAREIAHYPIPIWTGIGHEIDISVLDRVANAFYKTPTAVAEELVSRHVVLQTHLSNGAQRFSSVWSHRLKQSSEWLRAQRRGLHYGTRKLLDSNQQQLTIMHSNLSLWVGEHISRECTKLALTTKHLKDASSRIILDYGEVVQDLFRNMKEKCFFNIKSGWQYVGRQRNRLRHERVRKQMETERYHFQDLTHHLQRGAYSLIKWGKREHGLRRENLNSNKVFQMLDQKSRHLSTMMQTFRTVDPEKILKRGFAIVFTKDGAIVRSVETLRIGSDIDVNLSDGTAGASVISVRRKKDGN